MEKFLNWLKNSSVDPQKTSVTLKGILMTYSGLMLFAIATFHLNITETQVYQMIDLTATAVGVLITLLGLGRKIYLTIKNK